MGWLSKVWKVLSVGATTWDRWKQWRRARKAQKAARTAKELQAISDEANKGTKWDSRTRRR